MLLDLHHIQLCQFRSTPGCCCTSPSASRSTWFYAGVALWAIALFSPVDTLAEDLLSLHMTRHLLIASWAGR